MLFVFVAMYEGHIVPSIVLRQTPAPLHISTDAAKPPCLEKSSNVIGSQVSYSGPYLRLSVSGGLSTMFPGFIKFFGSKARFNSRNAWRIVGTVDALEIRAAGAPVAVLARDCPAELHHQVGNLIGDSLHLFKRPLGFQVDDRTNMKTSERSVS